MCVGTLSIGRAPRLECSNRLFCTPSVLFSALACAMAASDNTASAAASVGSLTRTRPCKLAFGQLGRRHQTLKQACIYTETPPASGDEGGSSPAGASTASSAFRLDPTDNATNQVTASDGAKINNLEVMSVTNPMFRVAGSPTTASQGTQDPIWPPATGGLTSLESYLLATNVVDTARVVGDPEAAGPTSSPTATADAGDPTSSTPPTARPSATPSAASTTTGAVQPMRGGEPEPEGPPTPARSGEQNRFTATESRAHLTHWRPTTARCQASIARHHRLAFRRRPPLGPPLRLAGRPGCLGTA